MKAHALRCECCAFDTVADKNLIQLSDEELGVKLAACDVVWDSEGLLLRLNGRNDRLKMLIGVFQEAHPQRLLRLENACRPRDLIKISQSAHEIKGAAVSLKAMRLYLASSELESCVDEIDGNGIDALAAKILAESVILDQQFTEYFARHSSQSPS